MKMLSGTWKHAARTLGVLSALCVLGFGQAAAQEADATGSGWVYEALDLDVSLLPDTSQIVVTGRGVLRLEGSASFGPTLALNLNSTLGLRKEIMRFTEVKAGPGAEITINVSPSDTSHKNANATRLTNIRYRKPFLTGDSIEVTFAARSVGRAFQFNISRTYAVGSYEAGWYPVPISAPNQSEARLRRSKGVTTFHLPSGLHAFSNGKLVRQKERRSGITETWQVTSPRGRSFVFGPFDYSRFEINGISIAVYLLPDSTRPEGNQGKVIPIADMRDGMASAITILEKAYGRFPYESFGIAEIPNSLVNWWGSLEDGFMIGTTGSLSTTRVGVLTTISHEVSHAWWGGDVDVAGPGAYLCNEAMANFSSRYFFEEYMGPELASWLSQFGQSNTPPDFNYSAKGYFRQARAGKDKPLSETEQGNGDDYNLASAKGSLVWEMLRRRIGSDELFFRVLRSLASEHSGKTLTLNAMREAFIAAAPEEAKLKQFFSQWLDRAGAPRLEASWQAGDGKHVELTIRQTHGGEPYHLMVELDVYSGGDPVRKTVELRGAVTSAVFETDGAARDVVVDPEHRLLVWTPDDGPFPGKE